MATVARCFFSSAAINHLALHDNTLNGRLNAAPEFWNLVLGTSQTTLFIALGRIFDQGKDVPFTLDRLLQAARRGGGAIFAANRLADRKRRFSGTADDWLEEYPSHIFVPTPQQFKGLKKLLGRYRKQFEATYRPIRVRVYAHGIATEQELSELFAETRRVEVERIIRILQRVGDGLWNLYHNGQNPLKRGRFPPTGIGRLMQPPPYRGNTSDQEIIIEAVRTVMAQLGDS